MRTLSFLVAMGLLMCAGRCALAAKPQAIGSAKAAANAPLGAANFTPSPQRPVGWRGDGTGIYAGATPPQTWSRRFADCAITKAFYQARKPQGDDVGSDARPLELGIVKDWLVLGPFAADDPQADIEKAYIEDEANVQPNENDKAGSLTWKSLHATIDTQSTHYTNEGTCQDYNVDFIFLYGQLKNQVAYAHSYIYSPTGGTVQFSLHRAGAATKIWLNGQPKVLNPKDWADIHRSDITLNKGWNRLLVKLSCTDGTRPEGQNAWISKWRFSVYFSAPLPATYTTHNIAWMAKLPGFSASSPVVVGDRIFATCGTSDVVCLNKADGKILWLTTATPWDALTDSEKADNEFQESVKPLVEKLQQLDEELVPQFNALNSLHGAPKNQQEKVDAALKRKEELEKKLHDALRSIDRKRFVPMYGNEVSGSNGTPCTDGERVYVALGGGMKGPGAYVIAAYTLDGKRVWSYHEALGAPEHGSHISPALINGKLIFAANTTLMALDAATGKVAWQDKLLPDAQNCSSCLFVKAMIGKAPVLIAYPNWIVNPANGEVLWKGKQNNDNYFSSLATPWTERGYIFVDGGVFKKALRAIELPTTPQGTSRVAWQLEDKQWRLEESSGFSIASSILTGGLYYTLDTMGVLTVLDPASGRVAYMRRVEMFQRANRQIYGFTASPTIGGKNLYIFDNTGSSLLLAPGPVYKEVGRNVIENQVASAWEDYKQERFYASPVFDGSAIYLKGSEYLYCIREE